MKQMNPTAFGTSVLARKLAIGALALSAGICAHATSIIGDTFQITWQYPNSGTTFESFSGTLTASGLTWSPGAATGLNFVMLTDGTVVINNATAGWSAASFNGFLITDLTQSANFTSLALQSVTGAIPPIAPATSFSANQLSINFTPTGVQNTASSGTGQVYTFSFTTGASGVPDTGSTVLMLGCGLVGLAVLAIRQKVA